MKRDTLLFRHAAHGDLTSIVRLLADDAFGARRECVAALLLESYRSAFDAIARDPNNEVIVGNVQRRVVSVMQIMFIPYLAYQGSWRALIEGVRVASELRGRGIGYAMMRWAVARARERNCHMVQLLTDRRRVDARRFYVRLGFEPSAVGMKLHLSPDPCAPEPL